MRLDRFRQGRGGGGVGGRRRMNDRRRIICMTLFRVGGLGDDEGEAGGGDDGHKEDKGGCVDSHDHFGVPG